MDIRIIHFYPDLMNLYGSYANVLLLKQRLKSLGGEITLETVSLGEEVDIRGSDFIFMGAGTERRQKAALNDFLRFENAVKFAAESGVSMLFCGTAMELLGRTVTEAGGKVYAGIGLGSFSSVQGKQRFVEDVYGRTELCTDAVVGFMNKCSVITGVKAPLLSSLSMGFGNEGERTPEGFRWKNVWGSHLTGPLLVKNPRLLDVVIEAIYQRRGEALPALPKDPWAEAAYAVTAEQLKLQC